MTEEQFQQQLKKYRDGLLSSEEIMGFWAEVAARPEWLELVETTAGLQTIYAENSTKGNEVGSSVSGSSNNEDNNEYSTTIAGSATSTKKANIWAMYSGWISTLAAMLAIVFLISLFKIDLKKAEKLPLAIAEIDAAEFEVPALTRSVSQSASGRATSQLEEAWVVADSLLVGFPYVIQDTSDSTNAGEANPDFYAADSMVVLGFTATVDGNDSLAVKYYREVNEKYGNTAGSAKAHLNVGIIRYNDAKYQEATNEFVLALVSGGLSRRVAEKAHWYLANALINLGELEKAHLQAVAVWQMEGPLRDAAFLLIRRLDQQLGKVSFEAPTSLGD